MIYLGSTEFFGMKLTPDAAWLFYCTAPAAKAWSPTTPVTAK
jgi:hypothetical protein